ncbi:MAG: diheme cytochrome c [Gammaproteobacteria bacterium]|nr:diheme cytochrome c [Gammaproteobacteria bacterium]
MRIRNIALIALILAVGTGAIAVADDDDRGWFRGKRESESHRTSAVTNDLYKKECGGCHFAYQPQLLPAASWQKIMGGLDSHFGDNAELGQKERTEILAYLEQNAADRSNAYLGREVMGRIGNAAPLRITETRFFQREHHELPRSVLSGKKGPKSLSNCIECHTRADSGSYSENEIKIPGIGRWDD